MFGDYAWYTGGAIHSVATNTPNALKIYDMSGNAYEWCINDTGGSGLGLMKYRGGSYAWGIEYAQIGYPAQPDCALYYELYGTGFRVAKSQ